MTSDSTIRLRENNINKVRAWMERKGIDLLFLCDPPNVKYLVGTGPFITRTMFEASFSEFVIMRKNHHRPTLLVNSFYKLYYESQQHGLFAEVGLHSDLRQHLRNSGRKVVVSSEIPQSLLLRLKRCMPRARIAVDTSSLEKLRSVKDELEIAALRQASEIAVSMMKYAQEACVEGKKECQVAAEAEREMRMRGADTFTFSTIVSSGPNLGIHQETSSLKTIEKGEMVMIDLGATKDCYNAEFARTFEVGPARKQLIDIYRTVHEALQLCLRVIRPGVKASEVDTAARDVVNKAGYDYAHATGHGIGTAVWEYPRIDRGSRAVLRENMFLALEPAVYIEGIGGVRLEENVLVRKNGPEILTTFPFEEQILA